MCCRRLPLLAVRRSNSRSLGKFDALHLRSWHCGAISCRLNELRSGSPATAEPQTGTARAEGGHINPTVASRSNSSIKRVLNVCFECAPVPSCGRFIWTAGGDDRHAHPAACACRLDRRGRNDSGNITRGSMRRSNHDCELAIELRSPVPNELHRTCTCAIDNCIYI